MSTNGIIKLLKDKAKLVITVAIIGIITTFTVTVREKLYFMWHSDHYYEMIFEMIRSTFINKDGSKLYVIMEDENSGEVKYTVDILEDRDGYEWAFIYKLWIFYPVLTDKHGQIYIAMEHEGNKFLFVK